MRWKDFWYLGYSSCLAKFIHVIKKYAVENNSAAYFSYVKADPEAGVKKLETQSICN